MRCSAVLARIATAAALSAPNIRVAEVPKLADRIDVTTTPSPIGHTEAIHFVPSGDIFVDDDALIASQVTATRSRMIAEDATFFHRAGPRREVVFERGEARACIVTCGGVCPGLNTVVRELYLCLAKQYGVQTVYGVQNGYSGFKNWGRDAVKMDSKFVYEIQRKGGTVLRSSRGGHDTSKICDALIQNGVNMLFVIGGDGTMKGACKIDAEMSKRGKKCVVCCVPKTIDNDVGDSASVCELQVASMASRRPSERPHRSPSSTPRSASLQQ
jgi:6-phosphofructokinase 1